MQQAQRPRLGCRGSATISCTLLPPGKIEPSFGSSYSACGPSHQKHRPDQERIIHGQKISLCQQGAHTTHCQKSLRAQTFPSDIMSLLPFVGGEPLFRRPVRLGGKKRDEQRGVPIAGENLVSA